MAMKPVAKKILIVIGVLYLVATGLMILNARLTELSKAEEEVVGDLEARLNEVARQHEAIVEEVDEKAAERVYRSELKARGSIIEFNYTLIFQMLNFAVLVGLLYALLWDPLLGFLDARSKEIADRQKATEEDRAKAAETLAEAMEQFEEARRERASVRENAAQEALKVREDILQKARDESEHLMRTTRQELEAQINAAREDLSKQIGGLACDVASRMLQRDFKEEDNRELIETFLKELEEVEVPEGSATQEQA